MTQIAGVLVLVPLALVMTAPPQALGQEPVFIDFEAFPGADGILGTLDDEPAPSCPNNFCFPLSSEFESLGLFFTSGTLFQGDLFPGTPAENHYLSSSPLDVDLPSGGYLVSVNSYSVWTAVLWLLDDQDQVMNTSTLTHPIPGTFFSGTLSLTSDTPFTRFTVRPEGCVPADISCDPILNLDNLAVSLVETTSVHTLRWPLLGTMDDRTINLGFGDDWVADCGGLIKKHAGLDLSAATSEPVYSAHAGWVKEKVDGGTGTAWAVTLESTEAPALTTVYWHVNPIVEVGQSIGRGAQIATIADLGSNTHFHFGTRLSDYSDTSNRGALPQSFCAGDPPFPELFVSPTVFEYEIFGDGFETGDTIRWSGTL